jgi:hypothetical protein
MWPWILSLVVPSAKLQESEKGLGSLFQYKSTEIKTSYAIRAITLQALCIATLTPDKNIKARI